MFVSSLALRWKYFSGSSHSLIWCRMRPTPLMLDCPLIWEGRTYVEYVCERCAEKNIETEVPDHLRKLHIEVLHSL